MIAAEERCLPKARVIGQGPKDIGNNTGGRGEGASGSLLQCILQIPEQSVLFCGIDPKAASRIAVKQYKAYQTGGFGPKLPLAAWPIYGRGTQPS